MWLIIATIVLLIAVVIAQLIVIITLKDKFFCIYG